MHLSSLPTKGLFVGVIAALVLAGVVVLKMSETSASPIARNDVYYSDPYHPLVLPAPKIRPTPQPAVKAAVSAPAPATEPVQSVADRTPMPPELLKRFIMGCAPETNALTQAAVVATESYGDAWALYDNNNNRSYRPASYDEAVALATRLIVEGRIRFGTADRGVDVGLAQINSNNFAGLNVNAALMLHPCPNLQVSSRMISSTYVREYAALAGEPEVDRRRDAWERTLQVYNSGRSTGDDKYVRAVLTGLHSPLVQQMHLATAPVTPQQPQSQRDEPAQPRPHPVAAPTPVTSLFVHTN